MSARADTTLEPAEAARRPGPLRVGLLGLGTVAGAVASRLLDSAWRRAMERRGLEPPRLVAVGVRDPGRARAVELPRGVDATADLDQVVGRDDLDVVVELLGGVERAGELVALALSRGRSVVTGNKALLARQGSRLEALARESAAALRFEAAVGGGTPILGPLVNDLAANDVRALRGIVNGTTNFILSSMTFEGRTYGDVLADAQANGYAEADPSADVEGHDAASKLAILVRLALGDWPELESIRRAPPAVEGDALPGITGVSAREIAAATAGGRTLKLVAAAERRPEGGIAAAVVPTAVDTGSPLGATGGVTNFVEIDAEPVGRISFRGPGAGGAATSSAVIADLLALARGAGSTWGHLPPATAPVAVEDLLDRPGRWLVDEQVVEAASLLELREGPDRAAVADAGVAYPILED